MADSDRKSENVSTRLDPAQAEEFEEYRERYGLTKSGAGRKLIERGLEYERGQLALFDRAAVGVISAGLAGAIALFVSLLYLLLAQGIGVAVGIAPIQVLAAMSVSLVVAVVGFFLRLFGVAKWVDRQVTRLELWLGVPP